MQWWFARAEQSSSRSPILRKTIALTTTKIMGTSPLQIMILGKRPLPITPTLGLPSKCCSVLQVWSVTTITDLLRKFYSPDIDRMTGFLTQYCCRTTAFARASPPPERQHAPTNGNFATARMGSADIAFIKAHLAQGSC
jgi:hypothetical protein